MKFINRKTLMWSVVMAVAAVPLYAQKALEIRPLTENLYVFTTWQPLDNGYRYPANGMYFLTTEGAVIIDTPWDTTQCQPLMDSIRVKHGRAVKACISTHWHADRAGAIDFFRKKNIATYSYKLTDEWLAKNGKERSEFVFRRDTTFVYGNQRFDTYYPGPGHSQDNIVIWFPEERVLYGGCFIKSTESGSLGNLSDADPKRWKRSIRRLQRRYSDPAEVIPGHESWAGRGGVVHTMGLIRLHGKQAK